MLQKCVKKQTPQECNKSEVRVCEAFVLTRARILETKIVHKTNFNLREYGAQLAIELLNMGYLPKSLILKVLEPFHLTLFFVGAYVCRRCVGRVEDV